MRYIVAVSGGIDSVVLLDQLVKQGTHDLLVAHFDHGIRSDSAADARFVAALAATYRVPFVTKREELGATASEEVARRQRYVFLRAMATEYQAEIVTAHHANDVVETMAINVSRGTGWRGMAILDTPGIIRPLTTTFKSSIRQYALDKRLEWVEDSTNNDTVYLRNQIRGLIYCRLDANQQQALVTLWHQQVVLKAVINDELDRLLPIGSVYSRYFFSSIDEATACELLRMAIVRRKSTGATRPQLARAILAIKTARSRSAYDVGGGIKLDFTKQLFSIKIT